MNDITLFESPVFAEDVTRVLSHDLEWQQLANTRVLITGATGMIPAYVVGTLLEANRRFGLDLDVIGLVRNEKRAVRRLGATLDDSHFTLITGDVAKMDYSEIPFDHVIHGASPARPSMHATDPISTLKANVNGTLSLLDAAVATNAASFTLMSSSEVYGSVDGVDLIPEQLFGGLDPVNPRASYSESKRLAETAAITYAHQTGLRALILRFGHIYGPGMALDDGRVQADFLADVVHQRDITLQSDGSASRTYTYVADAVAGLFTAHLKGDEPVYNVADPAGMITIRELAAGFIAARPELGLALRFASDDLERSFAPQKSLGLDASRLQRLGWKPQVDLSQGIDRMIASFELAASNGQGVS